MLDCTEWIVAGFTTLSTILGFREASSGSGNEDEKSSERFLYRALAVIFFFVHIVDMSLDWSLIFDIFFGEYSLEFNDDPDDHMHQTVAYFVAAYMALGILLAFAVEVRCRIFHQHTGDPSVGAFAVAELVIFGVEDCATILTYVVFEGVYTEGRFLDVLNLSLSCFNGLFFLLVLWAYLLYSKCLDATVGCRGYFFVFFFSWLAPYATVIAVRYVARKTETEEKALKAIAESDDEFTPAEAGATATIMVIPLLASILMWLWVMCAWTKFLGWTVRDGVGAKHTPLHRFFWVTWILILALSAGFGYLLSEASDPDEKVFPYSWKKHGSEVAGTSEGYGMGTALAISASGDRLVAGGNGANVPVRVYEYGDDWTQVSGDLDIVKGPERQDHFTQSVSMNRNGSVVAFAVTSANHTRGYVRVVMFDESSGNWLQLGNDIMGENETVVGHKVVLGSEGTCIAVGGICSDSRDGFIKFLSFDASGGEWIARSEITSLSPGDQTERLFDIDSQCTKVATGSLAARDHNIFGHHNMSEDLNNIFSGTVRTLSYDTSAETWNLDGQGAKFDEVEDIAISMTPSGGHVALGVQGANYTLTRIPVPYWTPGFRDCNTRSGAALLEWSANSVGFVRVLARTSDGWANAGSDIVGDRVDNFGATVAISKDGTRLAFGIRSNSVGARASCYPDHYGSVRVYDYDQGEKEWVFGKLFGGMESGEYAGEDAIALSESGDLLAFGARGNDRPTFRSNEGRLNDRGRVNTYVWSVGIPA